MKIETPRTKSQMRGQAEEAFYNNATLDSTNAVDIKFVEQLESELIALKQENARLQTNINSAWRDITRIGATCGIKEKEKLAKFISSVARSQTDGWSTVRELDNKNTELEKNKLLLINAISPLLEYWDQKEGHLLSHFHYIVNPKIEYLREVLNNIKNKENI